jgi:hypothetical protein
MPNSKTRRDVSPKATKTSTPRSARAKRKAGTPSPTDAKGKATERTAQPADPAASQPAEPAANEPKPAAQGDTETGPTPQSEAPRDMQQAPRPAASTASEPPAEGEGPDPPVVFEPLTMLGGEKLLPPLPPRIHSYVRVAEEWGAGTYLPRPTKEELEPLNLHLRLLRERLKGQTPGVREVVQWLRIMQFECERVEQHFGLCSGSDETTSYYKQCQFMTNLGRLFMLLGVDGLKTIGFADAACSLERDYQHLAIWLHAEREDPLHLRLQDYAPTAPHSLFEFAEKLGVAVGGVVEQLAARGAEAKSAGGNGGEAMIPAAEQIAKDVVRQLTSQATKEKPVERVDAQSTDERPMRGMFSHAELAAQYKTNPEATRRVLERWRKRRLDSGGFIRNEDRQPNEPEYLYSRSAVHSAMQELQHREIKRTVKQARRTNMSG